MSIYQDGSYLQNNPNWHAEDAVWKTQQIIKIIKKNNLELQTIAEVGCGSGQILYHLSETIKHAKYHGYDISAQAYNLCQTIKKTNIHFYHQDFLEKKVFFDSLLVIDVVEHIENYIDFLKKLQDKAKYKIFHIPLDISILAILKGNNFKIARQKVGHIHYFTKEIALDMLGYTGYKVVDFFYTKGAIELPATKLSQKILKIPRQILFQIHQDTAAKMLGGFSLMVLAI